MRSSPRTPADRSPDKPAVSALAQQAASPDAARLATLWTHNRWWQICPDLLGLINAEGRFVATNPAWQATLGWTAEEIRALDFTEFIHPDDLDATRAAWRGCQAGEPVLHFENRYLCQDGSYRLLSWIAVPDNGHVYCHARDVQGEIDRWLQRGHVVE